MARERPDGKAKPTPTRRPLPADRRSYRHVVVVVVVVATTTTARRVSISMPVAPPDAIMSYLGAGVWLGRQSEAEVGGRHTRERERERDVAAARTWQVFGREKGRDTNMRYYTRERSSVSLHVFMSGVVEMAVIHHADIHIIISRECTCVVSSNLLYELH